ncbi:NAD(P)-dependent oxidoreductase [Xanthocytophaga flava]|uniref:NAD(P)-dependent oxidoreductase n=1 Tax=Xanthocytophaga flava TaxID=3048013 RepID=UPI0028D52968|nr:NAD(P)-dependent oxidoreductase [Xanthocytophaga flavus]MDJ1471990.1 NAD(P)-dependent oxidoreductase [Xanthocytophaga flavus]
MQILVIDKMHASLLPMLGEKGYAVNYQPDISRAEVLETISNYEGIIVRSKMQLDEAFLERATKLKFIARAGAGLDQIDVDAVLKRDIQLFNAPEGNRDAVAEHAMGMLLSLMNHLSRTDRQVRSLVWDREGNRGTELKGKTVGIIGYGNTGHEFAKRIKAFGCNVLAYDKYLKEFSDEWVEESTLEEICDQAQVVSLHVPLTSETNRWFNEAMFDNFRHSVFFINTSRGEVAPFVALQAAIEKGKILGACLDVLENEKLKTLTSEQQSAFAYLAQSDKVLFSPHVAGWTHESYVKINEVLVHKISSTFPVSVSTNLKE